MKIPPEKKSPKKGKERKFFPHKEKFRLIVAASKVKKGGKNKSKF